MQIQEIMHLLKSEIDHCRSIPNMKWEAMALETLWAELETELAAKEIIKSEYVFSDKHA